MKIISGKFKGRVLEGFDIDGTRPTMDRVKESLFAMIQEYIVNSVVLDLFSGSGNLGIEALSEGAKFSYLVDDNYKAIQVIKNNIDKIGIKDSEILKMDYRKALEYLFNKNIKFDVIFLDPPYQTNYIEKSLLLIDKYDLLNHNGVIICESDDINKIVYPLSYRVLKNRQYGDKMIVILEKI